MNYNEFTGPDADNGGTYCLVVNTIKPESCVHGSVEIGVSPVNRLSEYADERHRDNVISILCCESKKLAVRLLETIITEMWDTNAISDGMVSSSSNKSYNIQATEPVWLVIGKYFQPNATDEFGYRLVFTEACARGYVEYPKRKRSEIDERLKKVLEANNLA